MSTAISDVRDREPREEPGGLPTAHEHGAVASDPGVPSVGGPAPAPETVVVRRNAGLAALVGAAASAVAIAYLWRATQSADVLDWVLCALMAAIAAVHLAHLVDARTPLLVADDLGVRLRLGHHWRGLAWDAVREVVVQPRRGPLHDGRLVVVPRVPDQALEGLDPRGRRAAARNRKAYGAPLAVPISLTTHASTRGSALADALAALGRGAVDVSLRTRTPAEPARVAEVEPAEAAYPELPGTVRPAPGTDLEPAEPADLEEGSQPRPGGPAGGGLRGLGLLGTAVSRVARARGRDAGTEPSDPDHDDTNALHSLGHDSNGTSSPTADGIAEEDGGGADAALPAQRSGRLGRSALPLRETRHALRADVVPDGSVTLLDPAAAPPAESAPVRRTALTVLEEPVTVRLADDALQPAADPVIGPELAAARRRVGLSVDELAERTRIRPHVIESIEVDDFLPCGGDFYARGHLRTLARVLGRDPAPLLQHFDTRYASAPVNARRVFEAELATGMTGSMRSTVGGPNWALLVGVVLALVLTWGVVRLFAAEPTEVLAPPVLDASAAAVADEPSKAGDPEGIPPVTSVKPVEVTLAGAQDGSRVVVRDRSGEVTWAGTVAPGTERTLQVVPPVRVQATVGGVIAVSLNGTDRGLVGEPGGPAARTLHRFVR
ncbi:MAG TPA: helix-turn-helix domain-containing protein [Nocardioidaceae bacterium]|nr:helix-turn-helix domain-containing protein [Nocardioidaceae bacterium]